MTKWVPFAILEVESKFKFDLRSACIMRKIDSDNAIYVEYEGTDKERPFRVWPDELIVKV